MNIPELSMAMAHVDVGNQIGTAVLSKTLDTAQATGDSMVKMMNNSMELSVNPAIGGNFDMLV